jgi:cell division septation protein DedD
MPEPGVVGDYRVQVGSFLNMEYAQELIMLLQRNGFQPAYEHYENYYRVVFPRISVATLPVLAQQLGALGIREIWIRREP